MKSYLDKYAPTKFRPSTTTDVFSLYLAQKLGDAQAVNHYVSLAVNSTESQLLCAYRRTLRNAGNGDRGRRFHTELSRIQADGHPDPHGTLISIRVERRTIAASIFQGTHLTYADSKQLSSSRDRASASAVAFLNWLLARFAVDSAALEALPEGLQCQRRTLHDAVCGVLRERLLPIWEVPESVLLDRMGYPPLTSRIQLRDVATRLWPIIAGNRAKLFIQDAALLGIHVQTERLFIVN